MLSSNNLEPKHFNFRLFLDDYIIDSPCSDDKSSLKLKGSTPFSLSRATIGSPKIYYNDLDELDTFCCLDDESSSWKSSSKKHKGSFSLLNFLPKKESDLYNDFRSIFSRGSENKVIAFESLDLSVSVSHFERLRTRLVGILEETEEKRETCEVQEN